MTLNVCTLLLASASFV